MRWTARRAVSTCLLAILGVGVASSALAPLAGTVGSEQGSDERVVLASGRGLVVHVPPQLRRDPGLIAGRPAMIVLHGLKVDTAETASTTGFDRYADRDGRLVAYPEGIRESFNAGLCCGEAVALGIDDVSYLADVVRYLRERGAGRIAVVGFSNGGMMAYRFACARPELVDTVGVLSATLEVPRCDGPIRALALHGEKDVTVPLAGWRYSPLLRCFLRDVRTIGAAAPTSSITLRVIPGYRHRWTEPGDPFDATREFWDFARMSQA